MTGHEATVRPTADPLSWPGHQPRTPPHARAWSRFQVTTYQQGRDRVKEQLRLLRATNVVISTSVPLRLDGIPRAGRREPEDPAAAVWFTLFRSGVEEPYVLACDCWRRVGENLAAIAAHLDAMRGMNRWGVGTVEQAFEGHRALPAHVPEKPWWEILGVDELASVREIDEAHHRLARQLHPDVGGTSQAMAKVNAARDAGRKARLG